MADEKKPEAFTGSFHQADEHSLVPGELVFSFHLPNRHVRPKRELEPAELAELERLLTKLLDKSVEASEFMAQMRGDADADV